MVEILINTTNEFSMGQFNYDATSLCVNVQCFTFVNSVLKHRILISTKVNIQILSFHKKNYIVYVSLF